MASTTGVGYGQHLAKLVLNRQCQVRNILAFSHSGQNRLVPESGFLTGRLAWR
jgi:hypothetical protein